MKFPPAESHRLLAATAALLLWQSCLCAEQPAFESQKFWGQLESAFQSKCVKCHGGGESVHGDVDLTAIRRPSDLQDQPDLLQNLVGVLDDGLMPPEGEPDLDVELRDSLVSGLQSMLIRSVASHASHPRTPMRRMNRFQYNNAVQDLFRLRVEVFSLPERMLREHGDYFQPASGEMPATLKAGSRPLGKSQLIEDRLGGVSAFPQDLRAEHGFDNRADHLTLSPMLLNSLIRLGRSIVDSPDFNESNCGIWDEFFADPGADSEAETRAEVSQRLGRFLTRAFRRPAEDSLVNRYREHVIARIRHGHSFTDAMKSAAAAALASPRFFYLYEAASDNDGHDSDAMENFRLASRLSFFLWGSIPDDRLLQLAESGELGQPETLGQEVDRMLRDQRLKRFCDSFPTQWLQLDRIVSSTPDPQRYPQFYFAKYRASMHMMLEPLLLFETILIEDRSILQLIDSDFSYRSDLLQQWYRDGQQGNAGSPVQITFRRIPVSDRRRGGVITSAAVMTMTSSPTRTQPITRGAWVAAVILNDPPEPPPANVPPLSDEPSQAEQDLTLRERFAAHRKRADCLGCHQKIDPLGFALENFDAVGIWRDSYRNGRTVDASGTLVGKHRFENVVEFKDALLAERDRFTRALAGHLLSFALARDIRLEDAPALDQIVRNTAASDYRMKTLIKQIVLSDPFLE